MVWFWKWEIVNDQLKCNELNNYVLKENFRVWYWGVSHVVCNHRLKTSCGSEPGGILVGPTRASPLTRIFTPFCHVIDWLPQSAFHPLLTSKSTIQLGHRSVVMRETCSKHLNLIRFIACSIDWFLRPNNSSNLHVLPIVQINHCSNTEDLTFT